MNKPLAGTKIAVLVSNGFTEQDFIQVQRVIQGLGGAMSIVSMNNGLTSSWNGSEWGLNFAADAVLNEALSADYSMLIVPGGKRSIDKLQQTAHTRRFLNGFMDMMKPVVALGDAIDLFAFINRIDGMSISSGEAKRDYVEQNGATFVDAPYAIDGNVFTADMLTAEHQDSILALESFLIGDQDDMAEAA